jgi:hypothetical protein
MVEEALILDNVYPKNIFERLVTIAKRQAHLGLYSSDFGRFGLTYGDEERKDSENANWIRQFKPVLVPLAREIFNSPNLEASYSMFAEYKLVDDNIPNLPKHKDNNACTYTIDVCLYQETEPWGIWIEGKEYFLEPNQAIIIYGEEQEHWREEFPDPNNNKIGMMFNHYVEPDHWWNNPVLNTREKRQAAGLI